MDNGSDLRVASYLGRVLDDDGSPVGTCFQVADRVVVTAWHVAIDAGANEIGDSVRVDGLPAGGAPAEPATVLAFDALHDLAVLLRSMPLPGSESRLSRTNEHPKGSPVFVTGHVVLDDAEAAPPRYLDAQGVWAGGTMREDAVAIGRMSSKDLLKGMSGAPVVSADGTIIGVVSARYNSADGWLRDSVWVARTEDLQALLHTVPEAKGLHLGGAPLTAAADLTLTIAADTVRLHGEGIDVQAPHSGVRPGLVGALEEVRSYRARAGTHRAAPAFEKAGAGGVTASMRRAGVLLAQSFLPEPVAVGLGDVLRRADAAGMAIHLGVEVAGDLSRLPWEALPDPIDELPLALHRLVKVYRKVPQAASPRAVPGPLTIVVAIAAPSSGGGGVLDYERELRSVLAAVRGARAGEARVRIVPFATTTAIRTALDDGDVHVLHVSGHGGPGFLHLENDAGAAREVTAAQFLDEAVPPGCTPAVISLAACYTDVPAAESATSFATELVAHGASAVIATETSVTDRYATRLFARVYQELAQATVPDVVGAVAQARRIVQADLATSSDRRDQSVAGLDEWGVVTVLAAGGTLQVFDPAEPWKVAVAPDNARRTIAGLLARDPGEFVGRRAEQRTLPAVLTGGDLRGITHHGVVLRGIGGVGKTTLAAELVRRSLERDPVRQPVTVTGATTANAVLAAMSSTTRRTLLRMGQTGSAAYQAAELAARLDLSWQERWELLRTDTLPLVPLLIVLDNFEDNLNEPNTLGERQVTDDELASLLAAIAAQPGNARVLVTCRYPLMLPDRAHTFLLDRPVGPLTAAETLKLVWALPRLDALEDKDVEQVWRVIGGHPRTLEYLDALLAGGQGRFPDITNRLTQRVEERLGAQAGEWLASSRTLDAALAAAVTESADDILLPELVAQLESQPGAKQALLGLSVYRQPIDLAALLFQIGEPDPKAAWTPDRKGAEQRILTAAQTQGIDFETLKSALANDDLSALPPRLADTIRGEWQALTGLPRPPLRVPGNLDSLLMRLTSTSLVSRDPDKQTLFVHRWTAAELSRQWQSKEASGAQLLEAHRAAAVYWQWRVKVWVQNGPADVADLLEARYHLLTAGDTDNANLVTEGICSRLDRWGALDQESALIHDTLPRLPNDHPRRAVWLHHLGMLAEVRGDYSEAERLYQQSLEIDERLGNQSGVAASYHQLGSLKQARGDYSEAERLYRQSLDISERLDDQFSASSSSLNIGILAQLRGDYPEAERLYQQSLEIKERLGDLSGVSNNYGQLGNLAQARGDYVEAERLYRQSLEIKERLGDQFGASRNYHNLGVLAQARRDYVEAERLYRQSLEIKERLGDLSGASKCYGELGNLAQVRGDYVEAERLYRQSLDISERLGDQSAISANYHNLGILAQAEGNHLEAERLYRQSLDISERLEDHLSIANTLSQLGILATKQGLPAVGLPLQLRALLDRRRLNSPSAHLDLYWLIVQRQAIGEPGFIALLNSHLEARSVEELLRLLDDVDTSADETSGGDR